MFSLSALIGKVSSRMTPGKALMLAKFGVWAALAGVYAGGALLYTIHTVTSQVEACRDSVHTLDLEIRCPYGRQTMESVAVEEGANMVFLCRCPAATPVSEGGALAREEREDGEQDW